MASPDQGSIDLPILTFGGRVTQYDPQTLPMGASPFCQDVKFSGVNPSGTGLVAGVATRDGLGTGFYAAPFAGNPSVNYIKTFVDPLEVVHTLCLDGLGVVRDESPSPVPPNVPAVIGQVIAATYAQSDTLFGREWMAISTSTTPVFGIDIPRQWDGTNFDRVSQVGPGAPPLATDDNGAGGVAVTAATQEGNANITEAFENGPNEDIIITATSLHTDTGATFTVAGTAGAAYDGTWVQTSQPGGPIPRTSTVFVFINPMTPKPTLGAGGTVASSYVTIQTTTPHMLTAGQRVVVAGVGAGYNGTWTVYYVVDSTHFTFFAATTGLGPLGAGGTITGAGSISAGLHQVAVSFITRENYITKPSPYGSWTSGGNVRVLLSDIAIGPSNIIARVLMFTPVITAPALTGPFFYFDGSVPVPNGAPFPSMIITDNVTTNYECDFLDAVLQLGTSATNLFNLLELGECSSVIAYSNRMFWSGERNKLPNVLNLTFDGGFSPGVISPPLGWLLDPVSGAGGFAASAVGMPIYWGDAYVITGDGATAKRGLITQTMFQDYLGVPIIEANIAYSLRVRVARNAALAAGTLHINLQSTIGGYTTAGLALAAGAVGLTYTEFIVPILTKQTTIPIDLILQVYADGTPTLNGSFVIDCIELFPTLQPYNNTIIRASYSSDPESFDQNTGYLQVGQALNQSVRCMFGLLDNKLYINTERGMYSTQDDGANEPSLWSINTVSSTVGTGSVHGSAVGEGWAVVAYHDGLYIFWGGEPVKITQEIQPDWDSINWHYDHTMYVLVDTTSKRIIVGALIGEGTKPNTEFVCDYSQLANSEGTTAAQDIASHPQAYYSVYNPTKVVAPGKARKWTLWNIKANCAAMSLRSDGSYHLLRGNGVGNGKIYDQLPGQLNDDTVAINSQYQTAYTPQGEDEQQLQLGTHRKTFKYLTGYVFGSGILSRALYGSQDQRAVSLAPFTLKNPAQWDFESNINFVGERMSILISTNAPTAWFELTKLSPTLQRELVTPVRGVS